MNLTTKYNIVARKSLFAFLLLSAAATPAAQTLIVGGDLLNGNFNSPGGTGDSTYADDPDWSNLGTGGPSQVFLKNDETLDGTHNALLYEGEGREPGLDTGYTLCEGDVFSLSYYWKDSWLWTDDSDKVKVRLFVTADDTIAGDPSNLVSVLSGTSTTNETYERVEQEHIYTATAAVAGKRLFLALDTHDVAGATPGFARMDDLNLWVTPSAPTFAGIAPSGAGRPAGGELISDGGFETLSSTAPNEASAPWAVDGEDGAWSVTTSAHALNNQPAGLSGFSPHGGTQAVCFNWNGDASTVYQTITTTVFDSSKTYEGSFWMYTYDNEKTNTGETTLNLVLVVSNDGGATWTWLRTFVSAASNTTLNTWQQFSGTFDGAAYSQYDGWDMQIRVVKPWVLGGMEYAIAVDNVSLTTTSMMRLTWEALRGNSYSVMENTDLREGLWQPRATNLLATADALELDVAMNADQAFFQVRREPRPAMVDTNTPAGAQPTLVRPTGDTWALHFSDEFNRFNAEKWMKSESTKTRAPRPAQGIDDWWWRPDHVSISNGLLALKISKPDSNTMHCGSIETRGLYETTYGFMEARINCSPIEKGAHTAFWLQGKNQYIVDGSGADGCEVDIFESAYGNGGISSEDRECQSVLHWDGYGAEKKQATLHWNADDAYSGFHTFGLHWTSTFLDFYYDGVRQWRYDASHSSGGVGIPQVAEWLWVSVGASFGDGNFQTETYPSYSFVDYVRLWKSK